MFVSDSGKSLLARLPLKAFFQRLPGIWLIILLPFAVYGPVYAPIAYAVYYTLLHMLFLANNSRSAYGMYVAYNSSKMYACTDWLQKFCEATGASHGADESHDLPFDHLVHVIILPNYKEEMDTLCETLDVLASHSRAITQYKVCLAMEESEADSREKAETLMRLYGEAFYEITFTMHPKGRPNEIRGKSSNVAWAAQEMASRYGGGVQGRHGHEVITVMDADTCFAEDYFNAVAYHYCVASPEKRKIMMFAPCTVFDRNANNVPVFVRVTDMFWSIGVISNLYTSSSVKIPCSAYSVSMDLAIGVGFWDAGPEAIGEDLHMYLKCFFATRGKLIVQSIFSPASQCNVEGVGSGVAGWVNGFKARYTQAKRHLWGSLDTGYTLRRALMGILAPQAEPTIALKNDQDDKLDKEQHTLMFDQWTLMTLMHRLLEAHVLMGHLFVMISLAAIFLPVRTAISYEFAAYMWSTLSNDPIHPWVEGALNLSFWLRMACLLPNVTMIYYYEMYLKFTGFERWTLQKSTKKSVSSEFQESLYFKVSEPNQQLQVQHLGKRSSLAAARQYPRALLDWFTIPIAGFFFYVLPQFHAQLAHLFTDSLDYQVAAKPTLHKHHDMVQVSVKNDSTDVSSNTPSYEDLYPSKISRSTSAMSLVFTKKFQKVPDVETKSSKSDEGYFEEFDEMSPPVSELVV